MKDRLLGLQGDFGLRYKTKHSEEVVVDVDLRWFEGLDRTNSVGIQHSFVLIAVPFGDVPLDSLKQIMTLINKGYKHAQLSKQDLP